MHLGFVTKKKKDKKVRIVAGHTLRGPIWLISRGDGVAAGVTAASRSSRALGRCFGGEAGRVYLTGTRRRRALNVPQSPQRRCPRHASTGTANTHQMGAANKTAPTTQRGELDAFFIEAFRLRPGVSQAINVHPRPLLPDRTRVAPVVI